jgi:vitamin B12 transporter
MALDGALVNNSKNTVSFVGESYRDQNQYLNSEKRDGNAVAIEYRHISKNGNLLQAGLRHDKSTQFSDATTWKLGYVIALNQKQTSINLNAGTGVVNPTYLERFGGYGYYTGGQNLLPEKNSSISIGLHHKIAQNRSLFGITAFQDQLTNEIVFKGANTINENGKSTRNGLETELQTNISDWAKFTLNHTFLVARNSDKSLEIRRPRHTLNTSTDLNAPFSSGKFTIRTTTVVGNWDNYTDGTGIKKLPDYTLLDFSFSRKILEDINFVAEINNLFDKNHKETWGYNVRGRSAVIKLAKSW